MQWFCLRRGAEKGGNVKLMYIQIGFQIATALNSSSMWSVSNTCYM